LPVFIDYSADAPAFFCLPCLAVCGSVLAEAWLQIWLHHLNTHRIMNTSKPTNILWRNGWAYFRMSQNGKRKVIALGTQDKALAKAKVVQLRRAAGREELEKLRGPRAGAPATIGKVIEVYKTKIHLVNESLNHDSIIRNVSSLRTFLRWAYGKDGLKNKALAVDALSSTVLADEILVAQFRANYVKPAGEDEAYRESRRRGADSLLRQAKSMFSKLAMLIYRDLNLPDLSRFRTAATTEAEDRIHLPIAAGTLQEIHAAAERLRVENPQLWLVHALQKYLGLRNDEICQARVEWFKRAPWGQVFFSVLRTPYFKPKRSEGHVPVTAEVAALFAPFAAGKQPQDFLVEAPHMTARHELANERHAAFMRQFLPAAEYCKAGYELRRWAAQVMNERYGAEASRAFLRHVPQGVAERHYFERWFPWRRLGSNVGVTIKDALGHRDDVAADAWMEGADVFAAPANAELSEPGGPAASESTERVAPPGFAPVTGSGTGRK
jgi:hypothetical protein